MEEKENEEEEKRKKRKKTEVKQSKIWTSKSSIQAKEKAWKVVKRSTLTKKNKPLGKVTNPGDMIIKPETRQRKKHHIWKHHTELWWPSRPFLCNPTNKRAAQKTTTLVSKI